MSDIDDAIEELVDEKIGGLLDDDGVRQLLHDDGYVRERDVPELVEQHTPSVDVEDTIRDLLRSYSPVGGCSTADAATSALDGYVYAWLDAELEGDQHLRLVDFVLDVLERRDELLADRKRAAKEARKAAKRAAKEAAKAERERERAAAEATTE